MILVPQYGRNWTIFVTVSYKCFYRIYHWSPAANAVKELKFNNPGSLKTGLDRVASELGYTIWFEEVWSFKLEMSLFAPYSSNLLCVLHNKDLIIIRSFKRRDCAMSRRL